MCVSEQETNVSQVIVRERREHEADANTATSDTALNTTSLQCVPHPVAMRTASLNLTSINSSLYLRAPL